MGKIDIFSNGSVTFRKGSVTLPMFRMSRVGTFWAASVRKLRIKVLRFMMIF